MTHSTTDVFEALKNLAPHSNAEAAKTITDYLEESKQLNVTQLKEIFLTKDDKIDLMKEITTRFWITIAVTVTLFGIVITMLLNILSRLH